MGVLFSIGSCGVTFTTSSFCALSHTTGILAMPNAHEPIGTFHGNKSCRGESSVSTEQIEPLRGDWSVSTEQTEALRGDDGATIEQTGFLREDWSVATEQTDPLREGWSPSPEKLR
jgi:hypothetical protein